MAELEEWKSALGLAVIFGLGAGLGALHLVHAVAEDESLVTFVSGILVPLFLSLGLLAGGASFARSDLTSESRWCRRYRRPALGQVTERFPAFVAHRSPVSDERIPQWRIGHESR